MLKGKSSGYTSKVLQNKLNNDTKTYYGARSQQDTPLESSRLKGSSSIIDQKTRSPAQDYKLSAQKSAEQTQAAFQRSSDIERKIKEQRKMDIVNKINELNMKLSPQKETPSRDFNNKYKSDYINKGEYKSSFQQRANTDTRATTDYSKFEFLNKYKDNNNTKSDYSKQLDYQKDYSNRLDSQYKEYQNNLEEPKKYEFSNKYSDSLKKYDIQSKYEHKSSSMYDTSKNNILSKYQTKDYLKSPSYTGQYSDRKKDDYSGKSSAYKAVDIQYESRITKKDFENNNEKPEREQQTLVEQKYDDEDFTELDTGLVDFKKKLKIQELELENSNLEAMARQSSQKNTYQIKRLQEDVQATKIDVEKQTERMNGIHQKEKEKFDQASKEILDLYTEEKTKNEKLEEQLNSFQQVFDKQKNAMLESINELKSSYEEKLKQFEMLTQESNEKLILLEKKSQENNILRVIMENPEYLNKLQKKPKKQSPNQMMAEKLRALSKIGDQKRQIITELTNRNKLKDQEMAKMAEVIENCKELMRNMTDDKEYQVLENKKMTEELVQFKELFSKRLAEISDNDRQMQDDEDNEQQQYEDDQYQQNGEEQEYEEMDQ